MCRAQFLSAIFFHEMLHAVKFQLNKKKVMIMNINDFNLNLCKAGAKWNKITWINSTASILMAKMHRLCFNIITSFAHIFRRSSEVNKLLLQSAMLRKFSVLEIIEICYALQHAMLSRLMSFFRKWELDTDQLQSNTFWNWNIFSTPLRIHVASIFAKCIFRSFLQ